MFSNLWLVTIIIFGLWIAAMGYYLYASRQQEDLESQVESLRKMLDESDPVQD